jgi:hypothetical protein
VSLAAWTHQLQTSLQDERGVQNRLLERLAAQEAAVIAGDTEALDREARELERELADERPREQRRRALIARFAGELGVPAELLTVGSLMERLEARGIATDGLRRVRDELRESVLGVHRRARKLRALAKGHRDVLGDVLRLIAGGGDRHPEAGILIDAEA